MTLRGSDPSAVHDVDLVVPIAVAREGDLSAIGRPGGADVQARAPREAMDDLRSVGVHHIDLEITGSARAECDLSCESGEYAGQAFIPAASVNRFRSCA